MMKRDIPVFQGGVIKSDAIHAYYYGNVFVPLAPVKAKLNQPVIVMGELRA
jgi:hypothetical protein